MRFWGKMIQSGHLLRDTVVELDGPEKRTAKVLEALKEVCLRFDLPVPVWLEKNVRDFQRVAKVRFNKDSFIEKIEFDYLEFQVIEEDPWV